MFFESRSDGYVGMITSNAFMKRSFGKKLIEEHLPTWDVHVIDTSGVYLPGHGTPTSILTGRNRGPIVSKLRIVRGIRGELEAPADPAKAPAWTEISANIDQPGFSGRYISVSDLPREKFISHPWSIGGGGAAELKERIDQATERMNAVEVGRTVVLGEEDVWLIGSSRAHDDELARPLVSGGLV